ncbi:MAG: rhodanese-related sulfurtransferase [Bacteroidota bacterium]
MPSPTVLAFYAFVPLPDYKLLRSPLLQLCDLNGLQGSILLAEEGINGTVAGSAAGIQALDAWLDADGRFGHREAKYAKANEMPFKRMKVRLKREIVSLGQHGIDPTRETGTYVEPAAWNELISSPDVVVIDTRNDYEIEAGTFEGAIDPQTPTFRDFPAFVEAELDPAQHTKVAMFCTGGIRCEKATAYLLQEGFRDVYHLKGGILNYLEYVDPEESMWQGECFVFDERVTVDHALQPGSFGLCFGCKRPVSPEAMQAPEYEEGVSCPACYAEKTEHDRASARERHRQEYLARARGQRHVGRVEA